MSNEIFINESVILIRISKLFHEGMTTEELYEATRGVWKIGQRRNDPDYAFSVANGEVKSMEERAIENPDINVTIDGSVLLEIINKSTNAMQAYMAGKIKVKGSMTDLLKLQKLL